MIVEIYIIITKKLYIYYRYQQALVTTVVFMGMMLSSTFWGHLSDRYGRKPVRLLNYII